MESAWPDVSAPGADGAVDGNATERERARQEFYSTYDVMTGVRIAATLGGFFALMVFLIVYKSRSKSLKALNDPQLVRMAEATVAEEQAREEQLRLTAAIEDALCEQAPPPRPLQPPPPRRASKPHARRLSSLCSSSASAYLERRPSSAVVFAAPLARDAELASLGADSVFAESTDDEVEQFSTDSGGTEMPARCPPARATRRGEHLRETLF